MQPLIFTEIQFKEGTRPGDDQHAPINQVSLIWTARWVASVAWSLWPIREQSRSLQTDASSMESELPSKQRRPLRHFLHLLLSLLSSPLSFIPAQSRSTRGAYWRERWCCSSSRSCAARQVADQEVMYKAGEPQMCGGGRGTSVGQTWASGMHHVGGAGLS